MKQEYNWLVKRGRILLFQDGDKIHFEIGKENNESCLLTKEDAEDVVSILTSLAGAIWDTPEYIKEPYKGQIYKIDEDKGSVYWESGNTRLNVDFNIGEDAIEINCSDDAVFKASVNQAVEIIQVVTQYCKQYKP